MFFDERPASANFSAYIAYYSARPAMMHDGSVEVKLRLRDRLFRTEDVVRTCGYRRPCLLRLLQPPLFNAQAAYALPRHLLTLVAVDHILPNASTTDREVEISTTHGSREETCQRGGLSFSLLCSLVCLDTTSLRGSAYLYLASLEIC